MLNKFFQKQQLIMTMLGYYDGTCDGVWGPKCVAAKRQWEFEDNFEPAVPQNGRPFTGRGKLPKGMHYAYKGLDIIWDKWDQARADEILSSEKGQMLTRHHVNDHVMQAQQPAEDVTVEPEITARGQQQSALPTSTIKPFEKQDESEQEEADEDTENQQIDDSVKADDAEDNSDSTNNQPEQKRDWLQGKKRK